LDVNIRKTKVLIFGNGPSVRMKHTFFIGDNQLVVDSFTYLGINFTRNRRIINGITSLVEKGNKAMFSLLKRARNLNLPIDCLLSAFDKMILPILSYGSKVWGYEDLEIIEKPPFKIP
jgi:hypothetical protein